ncbi:hypothetical protein B0H13DRAFT_1880783 [Mycena leptocephala]|nr:hypothetical protein B0H13DRAFT_1880783 [Mycena leptocephala]
MVGNDFLGHGFLSLENTATWINPNTFEAYMTDNQDSFAQHHYYSKRTTEDRAKLGAAVDAVGLTGLTVQKLPNTPATSAVYNGKQAVELSPAFTDKRKVCDFIGEKTKNQYPRGMGWEGDLFPPVLNVDLKRYSQAYSMSFANGKYSS